MTDKVQKIRKVIEKRYDYWREKELNSHSIESETRMSECQHLLLMVDSLQKEPVEEDFEKALANEWKAYNDKGAATVDALEDNTQELAFAKGFYRGSNWQRNQDQSTIELAEDHAMLAGMEKMKQQMMAKAIDGKVIANGMGNPILHLWDKGRHLIDKKVKVIVIKEN